MYKEIILSKIKEYCRLKKIDFQGIKCVTLHCVLCDKPGMTASVIPNTAKIICHSCNDNKEPRRYNLIDVSRKVENLPNASDEEILTLLRNQLNLNVTTENDDTIIANVLAKFETRGWCLVPCSRAAAIGAIGNSTKKVFTGKEPIQKNWQNIQNRDKTEWFHWLRSGLNIGVRTGTCSNLGVVDLDFLTKEEKVEWALETTTDKRRKEIEAKKIIPPEIKAVMGEPLIQETLGGFHLCYLAFDLPKGATNLFGLHLDIETEGGQVLIYPSFHTGITQEFKENPDDKYVSHKIIGYSKRKWINDVPLTKIPDDFYNLLKANTKKAETKPIDQVEDAEITKAIKDENLKVKDFTHNRTNTLIKLGGILRKSMNIIQVQNAVSVFNNCIFEDPLPKQEVDHVIESIDKYIDDTETIITKNIVEYLQETDIASKMDIELSVCGKRAVGEEKLRLERALSNLLIKHKIAKYGLRNYKLIKEMNWSDTITDVGAPAGFKIPYFDDFAYFNKGDIILVQGAPKTGKTHLSMNFLKRIILQNLKPNYIYNEGGGRYAKISLMLGLKDGDYFRTRCNNPEDLILKPNGIYVYDWLRISDFSKTADVYDRLVQKLEDSNSLMIAFGQLRENNTQFASDLINQFLCMSVKYVYDDDDGINTHFEIEHVRDRKASGKRWIIPTRYIDETKEIKTIEEIEEEERASQNKKDIK